MASVVDTIEPGWSGSGFAKDKRHLRGRHGIGLVTNGHVVLLQRPSARGSCACACRSSSLCSQALDNPPKPIHSAYCICFAASFVLLASREWQASISDGYNDTNKCDSRDFLTYSQSGPPLFQRHITFGQFFYQSLSFFLHTIGIVGELPLVISYRLRYLVRSCCCRTCSTLSGTCSL